MGVIYEWVNLKHMKRRYNNSLDALLDMIAMVLQELAVDYAPIHWQVLRHSARLHCHLHSAELL